MGHQPVEQRDGGQLAAAAVGHLRAQLLGLLGVELRLQVGEQIVPAHPATLA